MSENNSSSNSVDRWRRLLEDAENELEVKSQQWAQDERLLCGAINKITRLQSSDGELGPIMTAVRAAIKEGFDRQSFEQAMSLLTDTVVKQGESAAVTSPGGELRQLLQTMRLPEQYREQVEHLIRITEQAGDEDGQAAAIEEMAAFLRQLAAQPQSAGNDRLCAMVVSEVLYQLLERLSLPRELEERSQRLRQGLERGVEMGAWLEMLEEIADMAAVIRNRINRERLETEEFLKTVTTRLGELDQFMKGNEALQQQARHDDRLLTEAVKKEAKSLQASVNAGEDLGKLKTEITQRLGAIVSHLDHHRQQGVARDQHAGEDVQALKARLRKLEKEGRELRARVRKERKAAMQDGLTGIGNRLAYDERMRLEFARWKRYGKPLSLLVWDVDHFKQINDNYGHQAGDNALKSIAKILSTKVRETDFFARYGGEEFVLIMPEADVKRVFEVADKLRRAVEKTAFHFQGKPVTITISCGIAEFAQGDDPEAVFKRADQALYRAKQQGRNRVMGAESE